MAHRIYHRTGEGGERRVCRPKHEWEGVGRPIVDPSIHEWQHEDLRGRACLCGRMVYHEELCGCSVPKWEIKERPV